MVDVEVRIWVHGMTTSTDVVAKSSNVPAADLPVELRRLADDCVDRTGRAGVAEERVVRRVRGQQ